MMRLCRNGTETVDKSKSQLLTIVIPFEASNKYEGVSSVDAGKRDLLFPPDVKINKCFVDLTVFASYKVFLFSLVLTYCHYKHISKKTNLSIYSELSSFSKSMLAKYQPNFVAEREWMRFICSSLQMAV